jgi:hypothetical protein
MVKTTKLRAFQESPVLLAQAYPALSGLLACDQLADVSLFFAHTLENCCSS